MAINIHAHQQVPMQAPLLMNEPNRSYPHPQLVESNTHMPVWVRFDVFDALCLDCDPDITRRDIVAGYNRNLRHLTGLPTAPVWPTLTHVLAAFEYLRHGHPERVNLAYENYWMTYESTWNAEAAVASLAARQLRENRGWDTLALGATHLRQVALPPPPQPPPPPGQGPKAFN
ncbi:MAG: hypothetical protein Q9187_007760 [Circinaria calcarea]